ncbi:MAG: DUF885 domain-containing protein, partial [Planctomycetota bacterium]
LRAALAELDRDAERIDRLYSLIPQAPTIVDWIEDREAVRPLDPDATAAEVAATSAALRERLDSADFSSLSPVEANRVARDLERLERALGEWYRFRADYDPQFTWWLERPTANLRAVLADFGSALRQQATAGDGAGDPTLIADPLGPAALEAAIAREFLPYSAAELIAIGEAELAATERELIAASRELGFGDDWRAALEHVRTLHVAPGEQPALIAGMVREAIDFVTERDLVSVPPLARETWRMTMLSPERQRIAPYFLGGEEIQVAFPTAQMSDADKRATWPATMCTSLARSCTTR